MKLLKLIAVATLLLAGKSQSFGQIYLGGQANYTNYAGYDLSFIGVGFNGDYVSDRITYRATFNLGLPRSYDRTYHLNSNDWTMPDSEVEGVEKYSVLNLWLDVNYFFTGDGEDGGFYGKGGLGFSFLRVANNLGDYNENMYHTNFEDRENYLQPILRFGLGYDLELDFGNVFFEGYGNLPANTVNGVAIDVQLPFSFAAAAGVRIPL
ncbi:hypothetical protein SAMN05216474_2992 [Lishizhenia tianjinensis]|uniref:Outer membrane protein beta-barrel domain-containing protein n=1 Tax=Lishizhenia tianjinensis TaxID=477690 RepID=A0A1I7BQB9_9FLAO|nr:hypothetical protein [Lishizhenia tianjinensis]SFT89356.1 hypothetical protein SAMN05216474_2992 [Lishizhenia tianjinensis]